LKRDVSVLGFWAVAQRYPDRPAVRTVGGRSFSYGQLGDDVNRLARLLRRLGVERGDNIVVVGASSHEFLTVCLAGLQIAVYVVPASPKLPPAELGYLVSDSRAAAIIATSDVPESWLEAVDDSYFDRGRRLTFSNTPGRADPARELMANESSDPPDKREAGQIMAYSSGTTGRPKGVRRPLPDSSPEIAAAKQAARVLELGVTLEHGVHVATAQLYHGAPYSWALRASHLGHEIVLMPKWSAGEFLRVVESERATWAFVVPTMFYRLMELPDSERARYDHSSLEAIVHAGAPCPVPLKRKVIGWLGPIVHEYYAASEGGGTLALGTDWLEHPGTVGKPWKGVTIKILNEAGEECDPGEVGTIYLGGPGFDGFEYYHDPQKTAQARRDGFVTAGDAGYLDEDGWLYIADRRSDLILSGGANVYPAEVESVLVSHPAVLEAGVVGVRDDEWGERVHAVVELRSGVEGSDDLMDELLGFCREKLAPYKCPKTLRFASLPHTDIGKLDRRALRADEETRSASS
jgi:long-chain acyl-CoA synthetase